MRDFTGFRFGQVHSEDLHLVVVSSSNRYSKNVLPALKDYTKEVPGGDGQYLFGQTFSTQEFTANVAFNEVDEKTWRKISQLFSTDKPQDLVFDELPFKTYRAKLKSKPEFKFICFNKNGERVYKGEGTLNFICYYPYAFGFNKYVVRAADYYKCAMPKEIITNSIEENPYKRKEKPKFLPGLIKDHYNVTPNMSTPWKGGYPSIEQVQWGELYFNSPEGKKLIDVRDYFKNVPEWEPAAQLLTTPTLDYDRELIYMPQYSRTNYYNMDTGLNRQNGMIGSRILVYNPGDVPIDFELKLGNLVSRYRANMSDNDKNYRFRISRYNVQRLSIEQAVDWCGLKTYHREDDNDYKYAGRYFTILENSPKNEGKDSTKPSWWYEEEWDYKPFERRLGAAAPRHCYYVEPIPREKLGYFIRLFYWQSSHIDDPEGYTAIPCNWEKGVELANRYEELYELCITDEERYELYWETLKTAILDCYKEVNEKIIYGSVSKGKSFGFFDETNKNGGYTYEDFVYDYIYNQADYIRENDAELDYGEFKFHIGRLPQYMTFDYIELNSNDFDKIQGCKCGCDCLVDDDPDHNTIKPLFVDSERRMVYNINNPEYDKNDELKSKNFYHFKPEKKIFNDNIVKGKWFKLPPGWSLIEIAPVVDEDLWGGKRWLDARPFIWGNIDQHLREHFDKVYWRAGVDWLAEANPYLILNKDWGIEGDLKNKNFNENSTPEEIKNYLTQYCSKVEDLENYLQFRRWYLTDNELDLSSKANRVNYWQSQYTDENAGGEDSPYKDRFSVNDLSGLTFEIQKRRIENAEKGFLKRLDDYWRVNNVDVNGQPNGTIDDWWWFANSYSWNNFPPIYWAYADLLNSIEIKYVPLFY